MIGIGEWNAQRNIKVGGTLLCAFIMGHVMQYTLQGSSVPRVSLQSFMHVNDSDQTNRDDYVSTGRVALNNIVQTSTLPKRMVSHATSGSFMRVNYAPKIAPDLPISALPKEIPSPALVFQVGEYPTLK